MLNLLLNSLKIEILRLTNIFLFNLKKLPILNDLFTNDIYSSKIIKKICQFLIIIFIIFKELFYKFIYFFTVLYLSKLLLPSNFINYFYHLIILLTILGIFINNKLSTISKNKQLNILIFNFDATKYLKTNIIYNSFKNLIINSILLLIIGYTYKTSIIVTLSLSVLMIFSRFIGEILNISFYKKFKTTFQTNKILYFISLIIFFILATLPLKNIFISNNLIIILTIISIIVGIVYLKLLLINKKIYKSLLKNNQEKEVFLLKNPEKTIVNKKGLDLLNTLFFKRNITGNIRKKDSLIIIIIYSIIIFLIYNNLEFSQQMKELLKNNLAWFILIIFFLNKGAIITKNMFINCDSSLLNYNFYKEKEVILSLFYKRLFSIVKINLIPAIVISIGNVLLLFISKEINIYVYFSIVLFILSLSILISTHYLVIYYLFQPFNKEREVKNNNYSLILLITYMICFSLINLKINTILLSIYCIIITIIYLIVSLILVKTYAKKTFKLSN